MLLLALVAQLLDYLLLDSQLTTVEATLRANTVVEYSCTAVRASHYCWSYCLVVGSSFVASCRRDFVFWMCHNYSIIKLLMYLIKNFVTNFRPPSPRRRPLYRSPPQR